MGISKRMRAEGHKGPSPLKWLEGDEYAGPLPRGGKAPSSEGPVLSARDDHGHFYRVDGAFYRVGQGPFPEFRRDLMGPRRRCNRCDRERDWTEGVCACGCPEFRIGDTSPSRLEREVLAEVEANRRDPLPGQLTFLDTPSPAEPPAEERDVRKFVVVRRRRRSKVAPGQMCFLDTGSKAIRELEEA